MKIRAVVAGVILVAAAAYAAVELYSYRALLLTNRAQWLANQGRWSEAGEQLQRVREIAPGNVRALRLRVLVALNTGRYDEAQQVVRQLPPSPDRDFLHAVWAYATSRDEEAWQSFASALKKPESLEPWMRESAELASRKTPGVLWTLVSPATGADAVQAGRQPVGRMLYQALVGRALFEAGKFEQSRPYFERAWAARDRNRRTMVLAAVADALAGDSAGALRYADRATSRTQFLHEVAAEADRLKEKASRSVAPSVVQSLDSAELRRNAKRVAAWARLAAADARRPDLLDEVLSATKELVDTYPEDPAAGLLYGDALEAAGRLPEAFRQLRAVCDRTPVYPVLLRMIDLAGPTPELKAQKSEFLKGSQVITWLPADSMPSTGTAARRGFRAFLEPSSISGEFSVPDDGEYQIALVASGDRAFGLGPIAALWLDGRRAGDIYVAREGWDVYPVRTTLMRGRHSLRIEYVNDSERRPTNAEDRNLYLQGVLITRAGGQ